MKKWKILAIGWFLILGSLIFFPWFTKKTHPEVIIKEVPVLRKVEKIVYTATNIDDFKITLAGSNADYSKIYKVEMPNLYWGISLENAKNNTGYIVIGIKK